MTETQTNSAANTAADKNTVTASFQIEERLSTIEAINEAKRCLHCKVPMCVKGCPIGNNIPEFIHELSKGNMGAAMSVINETSTLPAICGRVCPHENQCQGNCVLGKKGDPIKIGKLESFIADFDTEMSLIRETLPQKTRGKVAVIGSGPAGLTVSGQLARQGFHVTIFEAQQQAGGVLLYGIPEYRLPNSVVRNEIKKIEALGVEFRNGITIGRDNHTIDSIFKEGFDAIFIGTGTARPQSLDLPGVTLHGVHQSIALLHQVTAYNDGAVSKRHIPLREGERVAVIGCGNVAMDAARTAIRFGTDITVVYRGLPENMSASEREYQEAVAEGIKFLWQTEPLGFAGDEKGRLKEMIVRTPEGEKSLRFDRVFMAVGSRPANRIVSTTDGIEVDAKGYIITHEHPCGMTTRRGVFAGGDVVHRPQTVVLAVKAAKEVADGIARYVDAIKLIYHVNQLEQKS
ncbi:MAG: NAD(P)-dependent oxidoreductase [Muribaculaceae bacterium]|nr:NAD(P)-dependent oxidoreductase [Muribaculaceae bacterium]